MRIVYSRVSTAAQSLLRQRHILTEGGLLIRTEGVAEGFRPAEGVLLFEDPATTSKIPALERPSFAKVAAAAHPGDTLTVSELFRLCRDLIDIHAVRDWCQARGVALRVLSGPLSNFHDLAANDATTALIINVITAVGQFQRDLQNELTAEARGRPCRCPPLSYSWVPPTAVCRFLNPDRPPRRWVGRVARSLPRQVRSRRSGPTTPNGSRHVQRG
ncbi:recombinase family protein [Nonomuraea sp. NPDC050783]|uniref:recombinase family protein n=1 Tax=Nonomuraea sp. NPDC050783 TaxID=3154634 RepID=UPI00346783D6